MKFDQFTSEYVLYTLEAVFFPLGSTLFIAYKYCSIQYNFHKSY